MSTQLYLANRIVEGRAHSGQDHALQRAAELALEADRDQRRPSRRANRRHRRA